MNDDDGVTQLNMRALPLRGRVMGLQQAASLEQDLRATLETFRLATGLAHETATRGLLDEAARRREEIIVQSLWAAAAVAYISCFGQRAGALQRADVRRLVEPRHPGALELHDYLDGVRNRHIAHRDADAGFHQVVVCGAPNVTQLDPPGVACVGFGFLKLVGPHPETLASCCTLTGRLLEHQSARVADLTEQVLAESSALSAADWADLPPADMVVPDPVQATAPRLRRRRG